MPQAVLVLLKHRQKENMRCVCEAAAGTGVHPGGVAGGGVGWGAPAALLEVVGQYTVCIIWD